MGFPIRDEDVLAQRIRLWNDPTDPDFRDYPSATEWVASYAPTESNFELIKDYLEYEGFSVNYEATNRLLIQFSGTVGQFNTAFNTELHECDRENPQAGNEPFPVYCTLETFTLPAFVEDIVTGIVTADLPVDEGPLPGEAGDIEYDPPGSGAFVPTDLANAYGITPLWDAGYDGAGARLGVTIGGMFKYNDIQTFWQSTGITRDNPTVYYTMEDVPSRNVEAAVDVSWAGAMAPGAELIVYVGPDARNTSMVYDFNEAIARGEVDILTDSFAHREDSEPKLVREQYSLAAMQGASLGITLAAASGDSGGTDVPCSSPYVTCVGGTILDMSGSEVNDEYPWDGGEGNTKSFDIPYWQENLPLDGTTRAVTDVALSAGNAYWVYYLGEWYRYMGTSFSSPVFAGAVAVVDGYRVVHGDPTLGYMNPILYTDEAVQATFRDVTHGDGANHPATVGWDYPTGWGGPNAAELATAWP
ncbi:MAG: kumamolisin [Myxococcales bacterium]|nr:kumamolisin [Myxococcales bacterium]